MNIRVVHAYMIDAPDIMEVRDCIARPDGTEIVTYTYHLGVARWVFPIEPIDGKGVRVDRVLADRYGPRPTGSIGEPVILDPRWYNIDRNGIDGQVQGYLTVRGLDLTPLGNRIPNVRVQLSSRPEDIRPPTYTTRIYMPVRRSLCL